MERWEYQVVHLNVEPPAPAPPPPPLAASSPGATPIRVEAVFSKEYLEKEFPGFYSSQPAGGGPAREHPANQLRRFLNLQGGQGWQLLGFYPVGKLQMMIFRRPLEPPEAEEAPGAMTLQEAAEPERSDPPDATAAPEPGGSDVAASPETPVLERILERLEALERRLPASQPRVVSVATAGLEPDPGADLEDGAILPPQRCSELEGQPRLSTPAAARALGFRSAASLRNLAARSGYARGLVKRGLEPALAVYMGRETSGRGGRDRHVWVVLPIPDS